MRADVEPVEYNLNPRRQKNGLYGLSLHMKNLTEVDMAKLSYYFTLGDHPELGDLVLRGLVALCEDGDVNALAERVDAVNNREMELVAEAVHLHEASKAVA